MTPIERVADRFWSRVLRKAAGDCWLWSAGRGTGGYGSFRLNGKTCRAHRVAYQFSKGDIPAGYLVCHSCDVKLCCNPDHLWLGTSTDNNLDAVRKGRHVRPIRDEAKVNHRRGEDVHRRVLTEDDVIAIRSRLGREMGTVIAAEYGVSPSAISLIRRNRTWKLVPHAALSKSDAALAEGEG